MTNGEGGVIKGGVKESVGEIGGDPRSLFGVALDVSAKLVQTS